MFHIVISIVDFMTDSYKLSVSFIRETSYQIRLIFLIFLWFVVFLYNDVSYIYIQILYNDVSYIYIQIKLPFLKLKIQNFKLHNLVNYWNWKKNYLNINLTIGFQLIFAVDKISSQQFSSRNCYAWYIASFVRFWIAWSKSVASPIQQNWKIIHLNCLGVRFILER